MACGMDLGIWALCIARNYPQSAVRAFASPKAKALCNGMVTFPF